MQRVDDRENDPFDRRHYTAWCGVWRDDEGRHWMCYLFWHPGLWWDVFRPGSVWRGMRLNALRSMWRGRKKFVYQETEEDERAREETAELYRMWGDTPIRAFDPDKVRAMLTDRPGRRLGGAEAWLARRKEEERERKLHRRIYRWFGSRIPKREERPR